MNRSYFWLTHRQFARLALLWALYLVDLSWEFFAILVLNKNPRSISAGRSRDGFAASGWLRDPAGRDGRGAGLVDVTRCNGAKTLRPPPKSKPD
jgi:hypothetical protein